MKGLIVCEESQTVTLSFRERGHKFYSNDIQSCSGGYPEYHLLMDCFEAIDFIPFDFLGCHPPCTYLSNSGVRWLTSKKPKDGYEWSDKYQIYINPERGKLMVDGAKFFKRLLQEVKRVGKGYLENPIMHKYALEIIGIKPSQIIQPYQFGHTEKKAT